MDCCSRSGTLSVDVAVGHILEKAPLIRDPEEVTLSEALGRVLAEELVSALDVPPADNSAVDGYVLPQGLVEGQAVQLPVSQRIAAGTEPAPLQPDTAARIFTGAAIPPGGAAVLMQEDCREENGALIAPEGWRLRQNIRPKGQDLARGDRVLEQGSCLSAVELGLIASVGLARVSVRRRPRVALVCSGDELVEPGRPLEAGQIYNSNRFLLEALVKHSGCTALALPPVRDTFEDTCRHLERAAREADIVITTGGVSVGEEDHIKAALQSLGTLDLWRLALKPGKPFAFGTVGGKPVLGLPGNPTSVLVTFGLLARPFLLKAQGRQTHSVPYQLPYDGPSRKAAGRREYVRVRRSLADGRLSLKPHPNQSSGMLSSAAWADGLAVLPENRTVEPGMLVDYIPLQEWLSFQSSSSF